MVTKQNDQKTAIGGEGRIKKVNVMRANFNYIAIKPDG
jgi:hypothetical protein